MKTLAKPESFAAACAVRSEKEQRASTLATGWCTDGARDPDD